MRRFGRTGAGPTVHASRVNGANFPDPMALIRSYDSETNPSRPVRPSPLAASIDGLPLDLLDRLRSFPLFLSAPDSFLAAIGAHLRPQVYSSHDYILTEGDEAKAMYWLVRGSVRVTSRDGESTYAELKPGAFFGEIGILMDIPRTATIIASMRSLVVRLNKEDLTKELPNYPEVERDIREEAKERLAILEKKKNERATAAGSTQAAQQGMIRIGKRTRDQHDGDVDMGEDGLLGNGQMYVANKKRKSPSPSLVETTITSALGSGSVNIRPLLKELPLFSRLPHEILHFLGLRAVPKSFPPFHDIIRQGSADKDVYFIVRGEVEVIAETQQGQSKRASLNAAGRKVQTVQQIKARLKPGQYFGEVTSLLLSPRRTATVRSITSVECLMITDDVLNELWRQCSPDLRKQVELVAKQRLQAANDSDTTMTDVSDGTPAIDSLEIEDLGPRTPRKHSVPTVTFDDASIEPPLTPSRMQELPFDPDPFLNPDLDNMRSRSRRGSLAPPTPSSETPQMISIDTQKPVMGSERPMSPSPLTPRHERSTSTTSSDATSRPKRPKVIRRPSRLSKGILPDSLLTLIFQNLDIYQLMRLRLVSMHWNKLLSTSPDILHNLDLTPYNRKVTDQNLVSTICPFVGTRPRIVDISNCFHLSDEGFAALANTCGERVKIWRMKSVWDITGQAVLDMVSKAKGLEEVDLSNCRKVGDNLLARVVGWVVPPIPPEVLAQQQAAAAHHHPQQQMIKGRRGHPSNQPAPAPLPPGTVVGCPKLRSLTLSYCKHITDRSMAHIAVHAANRLEAMDLTRCTTITDQGFQHWSVYQFPMLTRLCLADCTYLTDNAIVYLGGCAKGLRELDLSFCCALSDTATEVLSLSLPSLTHLSLSFCGSAVSAQSLACIGLHLLELQYLSVRGCVRVTGPGVEAVVDGCPKLREVDVSQCKNLRGWLEGERGRRYARGGGEGRGVKFISVTDGRGRRTS